MKNYYALALMFVLALGGCDTNDKRGNVSTVPQATKSDLAKIDLHGEIRVTVPESSQGGIRFPAKRTRFVKDKNGVEMSIDEFVTRNCQGDASRSDLCDRAARIARIDRSGPADTLPAGL